MLSYFLYILRSYNIVLCRVRDLLVYFSVGASEHFPVTIYEVTFFNVQLALIIYTIIPSVIFINEMALL